MIKSKCSTTTEPDLYIADNRGGSKVQAERLERACGGCTTVAKCAAYALKYRADSGGMVWAGIPVPQSVGTKFWVRAINQLEVLSEGVQL
ncbi:WhiB family transcriptional regulator [Nocardia vinacea]|uniref:WhiB family transcriptional regulator n=1 Tax=Nocardia vinacea TaxID=96468 RepID=A0ABZ1YI13_9NOCA|nr:WhiB family transcriptional regulator [Nocardia vinacea]